MSATAEKARLLRLERLRTTLATRLDNPLAALEVLLAELLLKEPQTRLWEELHAAASRDGAEQELAAAYLKVTSGRRQQQLEPHAQASVLMHAADFYQGVLGDPAGAEGFLSRVLQVDPGNTEAFSRLERRFESSGDPRRVIELYALAAPAKADPNSELPTRVVNKIVPLPASSPISEDVCKRLLCLVPHHPSIIAVLETHCKKTKRVELAGSLIEAVIADPKVPASLVLQLRRRLVELYTGEAGSPGKAISHIEELLEQDPSDETARDAAERLLKSRQHAERAAAVLQKARRRARGAPEAKGERGAQGTGS